MAVAATIALVITRLFIVPSSKKQLYRSVLLVAAAGRPSLDVCAAYLITPV
jgi:hypothetical protein